MHRQIQRLKEENSGYILSNSGNLMKLCEDDNCYPDKQYKNSKEGAEWIVEFRNEPYQMNYTPQIVRSIRNKSSIVVMIEGDTDITVSILLDRSELSDRANKKLDNTGYHYLSGIVTELFLVHWYDLQLAYENRRI